MIADYLVVRRSKLRLTHLYQPNSASIYYFTYGVNLRALAAWIFGVWPLMRESPIRYFLLLKQGYTRQLCDPTRGRVVFARP